MSEVQKDKEYISKGFSIIIQASQQNLSSFEEIQKTLFFNKVVDLANNFADIIESFKIFLQNISNKNTIELIELDPKKMENIKTSQYVKYFEGIFLTKNI
ncbi:MAG: hypothetical protein ACTSRZ_10000 [Promethearchaeota archaeon]